jgi:hypothetical protein
LRCGSWRSFQRHGSFRKDALANALGAMAIVVTADLGGVGNLSTLKS